MRKTLRIGIAGGGKFAQVAHLPALAAEPEVTIAGIVTRSTASAQQNLKRWPIERAYPTLDQMIADGNLDALFVLTPKETHPDLAGRALAAGLDVFCEKPLATSFAEARRLANLAKQMDRILMVGFNRRYAEVYAIAHKHLKQAEIKFCVAQKNCPVPEYRATLENAIHMVDLLRWFCGEAESVEAHAIAPDRYREEGLAALIRFSGGGVGQLMAARCAGDWDERMDLYGSNTSINITAPDRIAIIRNGEGQLVEMRKRAMAWAQSNQTLGFGPEVAHFVECIRERKEPLTNGDEAMKTHELVDRILQSAGLPLQDSAGTSAGMH